MLTSLPISESAASINRERYSRDRCEARRTRQVGGPALRVWAVIAPHRRPVSSESYLRRLGGMMLSRKDVAINSPSATRS
jgi:hypothetical protein